MAENKTVSDKEIDEILAEIKGWNMQVDPSEEQQTYSHEEKYVEEPEIDISLKSPKAQKLYDKVNKLIEKIEQEKNPLMRHILSFKVKMLVNKIQRELDIQAIRENSANALKELKLDQSDFENETLDNISELSALIESKNRQLRANEEYDYESPYFIYPKKYVEKNGGIKSLTTTLKNSPKPDSQNAAKRIELASRLRKEIDELSDKLKEEQEYLKASSIVYNKEQRKIKGQELALTVAKKANIFSRIGNFFKSFGEQTRIYFEEKRENKAIRAKKAKEENELHELYLAQKAELEEKMKAAQSIIDEKYKMQTSDKQSENARNTAKAFRTEIFLQGQDVMQQETTIGKEETQLQSQTIVANLGEPQQETPVQSEGHVQGDETSHSQGDGR